MADLSIPNVFVADSDATAEDVNENFDSIETAFNGSIASILGDSSSPARIIVVDGSGVPAFVALSGDATISNTGVISLANNSVTSLAIATNAVDSAEIAANAVGASEIGSLPACILERASAQSIPDATVTAIEWNSEILDTDTMHSGGVEAAKIVAKTAGTYLFSATAVFDANNTGRRDLSLWGSPASIKYFGGNESTAPSNTVDCILTATGIVKLGVDDYVEARVRHTKGGAWDVLHTSTDTAWGNAAFSRFTAHYLGDG